ncbi:hypothetical protein [Jidongwangia harbinensis]|uniref:hypothetical protein n=1 Tax=Jidongwangia harbinensis TaxID=2878561 RepID=UPI001CD9468E|nr:hypothetical protein [Jidongwangia harbinensis]MCA2218668.1 hypothetical protein [Jidongwangia harbinensis]
MVGTKTYAGAFSAAAIHAVSTGTWVAAGALSPGKRRALRAGVLLADMAIAATQLARERKSAPAEPRLLETPILLKDVTAPEPGKPADRTLSQKTAVVSMVLSGGLAIGGRQLQKRWLARLTRAGHPHPHRALGIRMGLLSVALALPSDLLEVAEARRAARAGDTPPLG